MAIYNQKCINEECEMDVFQDRRKMSEIDNEVLCPVCNSITERTMHMPSFHLKGGVWFKNGYGTTDSIGRPLGSTVTASSLASSTASKTHKK